VIHGVFAEIVFLLFVWMAVLLSPLYKRTLAGKTEFAEGGVRPRVFRVFATAALHTSLLQLTLGAIYRHLRDKHSLWTHIGVSVIVVILALLAASAARSLRPADARVRGFLSRVSVIAIVCVGFQFLLGWAAFLAGGVSNTPDSVGEALLRSAHQANGAILLATLMVMFIWSRALAPRHVQAGLSAVPA
jgi:hypothetical protein